jgi:hypothetical protein
MNNAIQTQLNNVVEAYRAAVAAARDRNETSNALARIICGVPDDALAIPNEAQQRALDGWLTQLDDVDRGPSRQPSPDLQDPLRQLQGGRQGEPQDGQGGQGGNGGAHFLGHDSDDEGHYPGIMGRVNKALIPFCQPLAAALGPQPTQLARTVNELRANYLRDLKGCARLLQSISRRPPIHYSLYETLLSNGYMDLSKIRARQSDPNARKVLELGGRVSLDYGPEQPSSPLGSLTDLLVASENYIDSLKVAYPCLENGARAWFRHLQHMANVMGPSATTAILTYDAQFRMELVNTPWFTFEDYGNSHFEPIRARYLSRPLASEDVPPSVEVPPELRLWGSGSGSGPASGAGPGPQRRSSDKSHRDSDSVPLCIRFNQRGGCKPKQGERECHFAHHCGNCGGRGHGRFDCTRK